MRVKSKAIDIEDQKWLERGRNLVEGAPPSDETEEPFPFFFSKHGAALNLNDSYQNSSAFLICGGPSFAAVDKSKLDRVWTMTVNNATASYRGNANCTVDDPSRFSLSMWLDPRIQKFVPVATFGKPLWDNRSFASKGEIRHRWQKSGLLVSNCPNVVGFRRNEKFEASRFLYEETINWGCHARFGGGRSVMLPSLRILFLLGFRRVYLLGVDFEMTVQKRYHFPENRPISAVKGNMQTYTRLNQWFTELQSYFLAETFIVTNCNPKSKLEAFPFISIEDAITEATAPLGDYQGDQTIGMYAPLSEKVANGALLPTRTQERSFSKSKRSLENMRII